MLQPLICNCFILQQLIDRKLEKLVRSLMIKYLGELDDDDMVMFVVEHLKDHKPPSKIVEGLEPVRAIDETTCFVGLPYLMSLKKGPSGGSS